MAHFSPRRSDPTHLVVHTKKQQQVRRSSLPAALSVAARRG
ncbi:MAG TPA: hypothetical protein VFF53_06555 [Geobacteraceae bacterium]|nr:hypothetical protein [Geobacteraceae bacterium]